MDLLSLQNWRNWRFRQQSGGWGYHYLAKRYSATLWQPFISTLSMALNTWKPTSKNLVLIGPSGGYCLSSEFLGKFHSITAIDTDPSANHFFRRSHPKLRVSWLNSDYFFLQNGDWDSEGPDRLINDFPYHAFLFCNILGQITRRRNSANFTTWLTQFQRSMDQIDYFSFHDIFSSTDITLNFNKQISRGAELSTARQLLLKEMTGLAHSAQLPKMGRQIQITDHLTHDFFKPSPRVWTPWSLSPRQHHLIELTAQLAGQKTTL